MGRKGALPPRDPSRARTRIAFPKWLQLRAALSGAQLAVGPAVPEAKREPGRAPGLASPDPAGLGHPAGRLPPRARPVASHTRTPTAPRRPLGTSSGGERERSRARPGLLRRRLQGAGQAAAWAPRGPQGTGRMRAPAHLPTCARRPTCHRVLDAYTGIHSSTATRGWVCGANEGEKKISPFKQINK